MYIDSHAHFDDKRFSRDRDELLKEIHGKGIDLIVNIGCDVKTSKNSVALAEKHPFIYATVGFHPHEAKFADDKALNEIKRLSAHEKVVAIGEIGLDYHYNHSPQDVQREVFRKQLELAKEVGLPVVIHEREAPGDCFDIIKEFTLPGVYHCYSGSLEMAKLILNHGMYLSFTGNITFPNARKALEVIRYAPLDRLLIETDAPYMAPVPFRGERNHSGFVPIVAEKIAETKGLSVEDVAQATAENTCRLFGIKKVGA